MNRKTTQHSILIAGGLVALIWLAGFLWFVAQVVSEQEPVISDALEPADAIVVLTGGSERFMIGLELLNSGKGQKLFVSGVHPGLSLDHLMGAQPVIKDLHDCCIVLGHAAGSTLGNAAETKSWMAAENYHSLRLVTANYHMPRSLLVFHATMPDIHIIPHPVSPDSVKLEDWWLHSGTLNLLINEYNKYLLAQARLLWGAL